MVIGRDGAGMGDIAVIPEKHPEHLSAMTDTDKNMSVWIKPLPTGRARQEGTTSPDKDDRKCAIRRSGF